MRSYLVTVDEVAIVQNQYYVYAENEEEAIQFAEEGKGDRETVDIEFREPRRYDSLGFINAFVEDVTEDSNV